MRGWLALLLALGACGGDAAPILPDATPDARQLPPDARLAPCGIEEPGSRCADPETIERCDGTAIVTAGCDGGAVCGVDPTVGAGVTCLSLPASCGKITNSGKCSGTILTRCFRNELKVIDCAMAFTECRVESFGAARCTNDCVEQGVTAQGTCGANGASIVRCALVDGRYRVETVACPAGSLCAPSGPETTYPTCVTACNVGATGACDGDLLRRCSGGALSVTDCAARGEACVWSGDEAGYGCAPRGQAGALRVAGVLRYEKPAPSLDANGPLHPVPARGASAAVIDDASGRVLASAGVADDGSYQLRFDATPGAAVHVLAISAGAGARRPVRVLRPDGLLHGFAGPSFPAADGTVDLLVTQRSGAGGAFAILDTMAGGMDVVRDLFDVTQPAPLAVVWAHGQESPSAEQTALIWLSGTFDDDDSFDDAVILHELGHYVEEVYGKTSTQGGPHRLYTPSLPPLAWSEGWATYFSSVARNDPRYIDSKLLGGFDMNIETDQTLADPRKNERQDIPENTVSEILWDLGDGPEHDDDPAAGAHRDVTRVQHRYFPGALDRGYPGIDLVDFLDGFLVLGGAARCETTRMVVASRTFPYDFAGPVACPAP